jgi:hypothetical protein
MIVKNSTDEIRKRIDSGQISKFTINFKISF